MVFVDTECKSSQYRAGRWHAERFNGGTEAFDGGSVKAHKTPM